MSIGVQPAALGCCFAMPLRAPFLPKPLTRYSAIAVPTLLLIGGASPPRQ